MKLKKTTKKGFTIVELVIVIAVIAILAAVLIPTFSSLIEKANESVDIQLVRNINTVLTTESVDGKHATAHDAILTVSENGYNVDKLSPTSENRLIMWDMKNDRFILADKDGSEVYPNDGKTPTDKVYLWKISNTYVENEVYSVYLTEEYEGSELTVSTGVDVGYNTEDINVIYTAPAVAALAETQDKYVVIRTNSENSVVTVNSGAYCVDHYGVAFKALVTSGEYCLYGKLVGDLVATETNVKANIQSKAEVGGAAFGNVEGNGNFVAAPAGVEPTTSFAGGLGTKEVPFIVATSEQFENIVSLCSLMENDKIPQYIKLIEDVKTNKALNTMFLGELDGNGHTITFNPEEWSWPSLFQGTMNGDATFKNFTYVCENKVAPIAFSAAYGYTGGTVTFENITAASANPGEVLSLVYNYTSPFLCNTYEGNVVFRNCVNEISYSTTCNYNGIFIGNYPAANWTKQADGSYTLPTIVFENCVNKGTISGVNVGFFTGNDTKTSDATRIFLVDSPDYVNRYSITNTSSIAYYISGCSNEGVIIGTTTASAFSSKDNGSQQTSADYIAMNKALTDAQFHSGMMFVSTITDISLSLNNNKVTINPSTSEVDKYVVKLVMYGQKITEDAPQFIIEYEVKASAVTSTSFNYVTSVIMFNEYEAENSKTFEELVAAYGKKETVQFDYVEVPNADGSVTLVVKPISGSTGYRYSGAPDYNLYAQINGVTYGSVQYRHGEIA